MHIIVPAGHAHAPALQTLPEPQLLPHMPQCAGSVWRLKHPPPHCVFGAGHAQ
jgi:hypothetical protein